MKYLSQKEPSLCKSRVWIGLVMAIFFLTLLPFAGALDIHHVFAEVDHDGHEHSDFDLCQWVQKHTSGSHILDPPATKVFWGFLSNPPTLPEGVYVSSFVTPSGSRAPPDLLS